MIADACVLPLNRNRGTSADACEAAKRLTRSQWNGSKSSFVVGGCASLKPLRRHRSQHTKPRPVCSTHP